MMCVCARSTIPIQCQCSNAKANKIKRKKDERKENLMKYKTRINMTSLFAGERSKDSTEVTVSSSGRRKKFDFRKIFMIIISDLVVAFVLISCRTITGIFGIRLHKIVISLWIFGLLYLHITTHSVRYTHHLRFVLFIGSRRSC